MAYAERYQQYWGDAGYQEVLRSSPNLFTPDDHELWNNYPERQWHLPWTRTSPRRRRSATVALNLYDHYQAGANPDAQRFFDFRVGPVSFFVSDVRSQRTGNNFFLEPQWLRLEAWAQALRGPGVLVLAQPLFQRAGRMLDFDRSLANFRPDQARLCRMFDRVVRGQTGDGRPHDILIVSGDIHRGRHCVGTIGGLPGSEVHEFVASPASRVSSGSPFKLDHSAPSKLDPEGGPIWTVEPADTAGEPAPNNIAAVRMTDGTNGRVRTTLELWRVGHDDDRSYWDRTSAATGAGPETAPLFRREVQLR